MTVGERPLLFDGNCFDISSGTALAGHYNPRIDAVFLLNDGGLEELRQVVAAHEAKGHRLFGLQASVLRVERHLAGGLYSLIWELISGINEARVEITGRDIESLRVAGSGGRRPARSLDGEPVSAQDALDELVAMILELHSDITTIHENVRPAFELIATAWASYEARRVLPSHRAQEVERLMVQSAAQELADRVEPSRFEQLYAAYSALEPPRVRFGLGLHVLDVCGWIFAPVPIQLEHADHLQRLSNLLSTASSEAAMVDFLSRVRLADEAQFRYWADTCQGGGVAALLAYESQLPWRLMAAFDLLLAGPESRFHGDAHEDWESCMEASAHHSALRYVADGRGTGVEINKRFVRAGLAPGFLGLVRRAYVGTSPAVFEAPADSPFGLDEQWYKWLLLFETLYLALVNGRRIECPLAGSQGQACDLACPIRQQLSELKQRTDLPVGAVCQLEG